MPNRWKSHKSIIYLLLSTINVFKSATDIGIVLTKGLDCDLCLLNVKTSLNDTKQVISLEWLPFLYKLPAPTVGRFHVLDPLFLLTLYN